MSLYIPIWFYSNIDFDKLYELYLLFFTFQSGSILIPIACPEKGSFIGLYIPIWFYSNLVGVDINESAGFLYIPIWFYSNARHRLHCIRERCFTFQSGSILIGIEQFRDVRQILLYIPIWFYSNYHVVKKQSHQ